MTLGGTSHSRVQRVRINSWPGDGISFQSCDDTRVFDCTVEAVQQGIHPGSGTTRALIARNLSLNTRGGLFYCWFNTRGLALGNRLDYLTGLAAMGDALNVIAGNSVDQPVTIDRGVLNVLVANDVLGLTLGHDAGTGPDPLQMPAPQAGGITGFQPWELDPPAGWVISTPPPQSDLGRHPVVVAATGVGRALRESQHTMPALPPPVIDGATRYDPDQPDLGWGAALRELGQRGGGTLRLPGGRYPLRRPLEIPAHVTLAGYSAGCVLIPVEDCPSAIVVRDAWAVVIRDLMIEGGWGTGPRRSAGIVVGGSHDVTIASVDIAGFEGEGIVLQGSNLALRDSRIVGCTGVGVVVLDAESVEIRTTSATRCQAGFQLIRCRDALLVGVIAGRHRHFGVQLGGRRLSLLASNIHDNLGDGVRIEAGRQVLVEGNVIADNARGRDAAAGVHVAAEVRAAAVRLNLITDDQRMASQDLPIKVVAGADARCAENWTAALMP